MWFLSYPIYAGYCKTRNFILVNLLPTTIRFTTMWNMCSYGQNLQYEASCFYNEPWLILSWTQGVGYRILCRILIVIYLSEA